MEFQNWTYDYNSILPKQISVTTFIALNCKPLLLLNYSRMLPFVDHTTIESQNIQIAK